MAALIGWMLCGLVGGGYAASKKWHEDEDQWKKHAKHHHEGDDDRDYDHRTDGCHFWPRDVRVIREYYVPRYRTLPPGLQKKLYRTGHLPPGWERKLEPFPLVVERQLVAVPSGYR